MKTMQKNAIKNSYILYYIEYVLKFVKGHTTKLNIKYFFNKQSFIT